MADTRMRRVKLPIEIIAMVLSELTHAEAWRLRILSSAVNDWTLNVLVKRALQATALVARAPGSFIFYEPPGNVHGLRFSFLQKHGAHAIFQAKTTDERELAEFKKKAMLQIVVHLENNRDPLIIRHLKLRELSLDRDSVTMQCNWRMLFMAAFTMSLQQRSDQALATSPLYVWQPAKVDGMPGKWKKGVTWMYSDSQASTVSQRSTSTTSSSQHLYGLVAYDSASGSGTSSQNTQLSQHSNLTQHSNVTQHSHITTSSGFSTSQLSHIGDVPQSSPPRHLGIGAASVLASISANMLHSLSAYPDSSASVSSDPSRPPDVAEGGSGSSVLRNLGLVNPAPPISDPGPSTFWDPLALVPVEDRLASALLDNPFMPVHADGRYTLAPTEDRYAPAQAEDRYTPAPTEDRDVLAVASSPMSDSLAFSATIRPGLRGGGSSPLAGVLEEEEEGGEVERAGDMSWMYGSERDVSCMIGLEGETETQEEDEEEVGGSGSGLARTESLGTTLAGSGGSVGVLSRMGSAATESTDVEPLSQEEKGKGKMLGAAISLPLGSGPRFGTENKGAGTGRGVTMSPQVVRRTRSMGARRVGPTSSVEGPVSDVDEGDEV